jgi:hypothetical protein
VDVFYQADRSVQLGFTGLVGRPLPVQKTGCAASSWTPYIFSRLEMIAIFFYTNSHNSQLSALWEVRVSAYVDR